MSSVHGFNVTLIVFVVVLVILLLVLIYVTMKEWNASIFNGCLFPRDDADTADGGRRGSCGPAASHS